MSRPNFYLDPEGIERPIRYKAAELVNQAPPEGYVWVKGHPWHPHPSESEHNQWIGSLNSEADRRGDYDYYVAALIPKESAR